MHGLEERGLAVSRGRFNEPGRFGRMFPHLRSLTSFKPGPEKLGAKDGPMDGGADPAPNDRIAAGFTFLGQFLDHDITFDPTSSLERQNDPKAILNFRTPAFELDSVYGAGPGAHPFLYDPDVPGAFAIAKRSDGAGRTWLDLPRAAGSTDPVNSGPRQTAIIGDPRNDENLIISQLHLGFMRFHNAVLASADVQALRPEQRFEEAQRRVRWHYQWLILNEFLPLTCGEDLVDDVVANGLRFYRFEGEAFMPVEFAVAVYRFGHTQVRSGYGLNPLGGAAIFGAAGRDLRGNRDLPGDLVIDWARFFGPAAQPSMRIDTKLARPLLDLPPTVVPVQPQIDPLTNQPILAGEAAKDVAVRSLAVRNLKRGISFSLPSGQAVAKYMRIAPLDEGELWAGVEDGSGPAPLWYYILREAEVRGQGRRLHGVGARIVAEVFVGLLQGDLASFVNHEPDWVPTVGGKGEAFRMADLLAFAEAHAPAGIPPAPPPAPAVAGQ